MDKGLKGIFVCICVPFIALAVLLLLLLIYPPSDKPQPLPADYISKTEFYDTLAEVKDKIDNPVMATARPTEALAELPDFSIEKITDFDSAKKEIQTAADEINNNMISTSDKIDSSLSNWSLPEVEEESHTPPALPNFPNHGDN